MPLGGQWGLQVGALYALLGCLPHLQDSGSPKSNRRNGCRGMAGTKADLRSMSCCASSPTRMSTCSMCTLSAECICAFCSHTKPVVAMTTLALGIAPEQYCMAMSYLVLAALAMCSSRKSLACSLSKDTAGGSKLVPENLRVLEARFSFCSPSSFLQMRRVNNRYYQDTRVCQLLFWATLMEEVGVP